MDVSCRITTLPETLHFHVIYCCHRCTSRVRVKYRAIESYITFLYQFKNVTFTCRLSSDDKFEEMGTLFQVEILYHTQVDIAVKVWRMVSTMVWRILGNCNRLLSVEWHMRKWHLEFLSVISLHISSYCIGNCWKVIYLSYKIDPL